MNRESASIAATDEEAYDAELARLHVAPVSRLAANREEPDPEEVAAIWHYRDLLPELERAEIPAPGNAGALRALALKNPGRQTLSTTGNLLASLQMLLPGEEVEPERHSWSGLRLVIGGTGAYTVIEGERVLMEPGDLIVTPGWSWHHHGHAGPGGPVVWLDCLDLPLVRTLRPWFHEIDPTHRDRCRPTGPFRAGRRAPQQLHSPLRVYRWAPALAALRTQQPESPQDGAVLEYVNPATGGPVLPTAGAFLSRMPAGFRGKSHRHTPTSVCVVLQGRGHTQVGDVRLDWETHDVITVPPWAWHHHSADEEAIFFCVSDVPVLQAFGLLREERR